MTAAFRAFAESGDDEQSEPGEGGGPDGDATPT